MPAANPFLTFISWCGLPLSLILAWQVLGSVTAWPAALRRITLSLPLAAAYLVYFTAVTAPLTQNLALSLAFTTGLALALNALWWRMRWSRPFEGLPTEWSWGQLGIFLWFAGLSVFVTVIVLNFAFHDQMATQGHPAVVESMLRGNFPPSLMIFPEVPLKYHYGADLLSAIFASLTGLPGYRAIDITQIFGWLAAVACLYVFCREAGLGRGWTFLAMNWILLAAGWVYLLKYRLDLPASMVPFDYNWPDNYAVFKRWLNPGAISYFFQTPYSLGLSVFFAYLALLQRWIAERRWPLFIFLSAVLGASSLIQVMLFSTTLGATLVILGAQPLFEKKTWRRSFKEAVLFLTIAVGMAFLVGGMFDRSGWYAKGLLVLHWPPGYLAYATHLGRIDLTFTQSFLWYLSTFGSLTLLGIPVILWGLVSLRKNYHPITLFFLSFAVASFVLPHFFHYLASWDIIKWFTGFQIAAAFLTLWLFHRSKRIPSKYAMLLLIPLIALDIVPSLRFLNSLAFGDPAGFQGRQRNWLPAVIPEPTPSTAYFVQKLRPQPWSKLVLAPPDLSATLARYSGQAMAVVDHNTRTFGPKPELVGGRGAVLNGLRTQFSAEAMRVGQISWIIYPCNKFEKDFSHESREAIQASSLAGELTEISVPGELGCWKFYKLR